MEIGKKQLLSVIIDSQHHVTNGVFLLGKFITDKLRPIENSFRNSEFHIKLDIPNFI